MPSKTTAKRKRYSLTFKLAVVETAKKSSFRDAGRKHGVDESLVRRWARKEADLVRQESVMPVRGLDRARVVGGGRKVFS